jgi:hypothetical protein
MVYGHGNAERMYFFVSHWHVGTYFSDISHIVIPVVVPKSVFLFQSIRISKQGLEVDCSLHFNRNHKVM